MGSRHKHAPMPLCIWICSALWSRVTSILLDRIWGFLPRIRSLSMRTLLCLGVVLKRWVLWRISVICLVTNNSNSCMLLFCFILTGFDHALLVLSLLPKTSDNPERIIRMCPSFWRFVKRKSEISTIISLSSNDKFAFHLSGGMNVNHIIFSLARLHCYRVLTPVSLSQILLSVSWYTVNYTSTQMSSATKRIKEYLTRDRCQ